MRMKSLCTPCSSLTRPSSSNEDGQSEETTHETDSKQNRAGTPSGGRAERRGCDRSVCRRDGPAGLSVLRCTAADDGGNDRTVRSPAAGPLGERHAAGGGLAWQHGVRDRRMRPYSERSVSGRSDDHAAFFRVGGNRSAVRSDGAGNRFRQLAAACGSDRRFLGISEKLSSAGKGSGTPNDAAGVVSALAGAPGTAHCQRCLRGICRGTVQNHSGFARSVSPGAAAGMGGGSGNTGHPHCSVWHDAGAVRSSGRRSGSRRPHHDDRQRFSARTGRTHVRLHHADGCRRTAEAGRHQNPEPHVYRCRRSGTETAVFRNVCRGEHVPLSETL